MNRRTWMWVGAAALGAFAMGPWGGMANAADNRSYTAGRFALELDGVSAGFIKSVEGGTAKSVVVEKAGANQMATKQVAPVKYDDFTIKFEGGVGASLYEWMKASLGSPQRKDGAIVVLDYDFKELQRKDFFHALITEIDLPMLDASSKEAAIFALKFAPETVREVAGSGQGKPPIGSKQKTFTGANFRLQIAGLDDACRKISRIEAITIKQKVVEHPVGDLRSTNDAAGGVAVSNLIVTLSVADAQGFLDWQKSTVQGGAASSTKQGTLEYLAPDRQQTLLTVSFAGLNIAKITVGQQDAHSDPIKKVTVEMAVQKVAFSYPAAG